MILRDYQERAVQVAAAASARHLIVAPTGSGKTQIAVGLIRRTGARTLFVAHRRELILQAAARLRSIGIEPGIILAGEPEHRERAVQVASVASLARRPAPDADLIIIDEAHHARADSYAALLARYPSARVVGLTATPWRLDGRGLGEIFTSIDVAATPADLISRGYLVRATGYAYASPDMSGVARRGGDYERRGLELVVGGAALMGDIVDRWEAHAEDRQTIVYACSRAHAASLAARFAERGHSAEAIDSSMSLSDRADILARFTSQATRIVINVNILTEGYDCPEAQCCIMARPTLSLSLYLQMVGRVLRPAQGKTCARIHDHAGNTMRHGLVDEERIYSLVLDACKRKQGAGIPSLRHCKKCYAICTGARACPGCGDIPEPRSVEPRESHAAVEIPLDQMAARAESASEYLWRMKSIAVFRKYKPGWASIQFKNKYGFWPPR